MKFGASADVIFFNYEDFTLGGAALGNTRSYILGLTSSALF